MYKIQIYNRRTEGNVKVSEHFRVREYACKDGSDPVLISQKLAATLEAIRSHFNAPVTITSGYRTVAHNKAIKGSVGSQHMYGLAADIMVRNVPPATVADYAETLLANTGGIGRYKTFTHIDVRAKKARWKG